ncbi:MAG: hypothetical protein GTO24_23985 [candidate division Zixibacteria bacterium]|nr:hypothetical protein [candidate division Zixibacteria bacterium]
MEFYQASGLPSIEVRCLGIPDVFVEHGAQNQLRGKYGIDSQGVYSSVLEWMGKEGRKRKTAVLIDRAQISR